MKRAITVLLGFYLFTAAAQEPSGTDNTPSAATTASTQPDSLGNAPLFRAHELAVDLYSTYAVPEAGGVANIFATNARHGKFGVGLGATYWLTANFGAALDATVPQVDNTHGVLFDQVSLSASARLPLASVAPYMFGGVGRDFENSHWNTHAGLGLEWRFHRRVGSFVDARYVFASHATDSLMIRAGVRFPF
jgi:hypothetical protein